MSKLPLIYASLFLFVFYSFAFYAEVPLETSNFHDNEHIEFKLLELSDLPMLYQWMNCGLEKDEFEAKYSKILNSTSEWGYIIHINVLPAGYIQYYDAYSDEPGMHKQPQGTYGIKDLYIANYKDTNFQSVLTAFVNMLIQDTSIVKFVVYPNELISSAVIAADKMFSDTAPGIYEYALQAYQKVGFRRVPQYSHPMIWGFSNEILELDVLGNPSNDFNIPRVNRIHFQTQESTVMKSLLSFRPIVQLDFPQLFEWVHTPHVNEWWYPDALDWNLFVEKYSKKLNSDSLWGFIIYVGVHPIGYIQYYDASKVSDPFGNCEPVGTYGMDLYIGDPAFIGKGYGTQILRDFMKKITKERSVKKFVIDPHAENIAAIKTYEKVGFKRLYEVDQPVYGRILLMELEL